MRIAIIEDQNEDADILLRFLCQWSEEHQISLIPEPEHFSSGENFLNAFAGGSYEVNASWYLVKPYTYDNFSKAMRHCEAEVLEQHQSIFLPGENQQNRIYLHQISYAEQQGRYILIHFLDGSCQKYSIRHGDFAPLLLAYPYFCDCIRGIVVNFEAVDSLMRDCFLLKDGASIPISRLKYEKVREDFLSFFYNRTRGGL